MNVVKCFSISNTFNVYNNLMFKASGKNVKKIPKTSMWLSQSVDINKENMVFIDGKPAIQLTSKPIDLVATALTHLNQNKLFSSNKCPVFLIDDIKRYSIQDLISKLVSIAPSGRSIDTKNYINFTISKSLAYVLAGEPEAGDPDTFTVSIPKEIPGDLTGVEMNSGKVVYKGNPLGIVSKKGAFVTYVTLEKAFFDSLVGGGAISEPSKYITFSYNAKFESIVQYYQYLDYLMQFSLKAPVNAPDTNVINAFRVLVNESNGDFSLKQNMTEQLAAATYSDSEAKETVKSLFVKLAQKEALYKGRELPNDFQLQVMSVVSDSTQKKSTIKEYGGIVCVSVVLAVVLKNI